MCAELCEGMPVGDDVEQVENSFIVGGRKKSFNAWDYTLQDVFVIMRCEL